MICGVQEESSLREDNRQVLFEDDVDRKTIRRLQAELLVSEMANIELLLLEILMNFLAMT